MRRKISILGSFSEVLFMLIDRPQVRGASVMLCCENINFFPINNAMLARGYDNAKLGGYLRVFVFGLTPEVSNSDGEYFV